MPLVAGSRAENAACARKLAVMAELFARRTGLPAAERELWWIDPQAAVAAEMSAAVNVSQGMALHQTHRGVALRDRLPNGGGVVRGRSGQRPAGAHHRMAHLPDHRAGTDGRRGRRTGRTHHRLGGVVGRAKPRRPSTPWSSEYDPAALRRARESTSGPTVEFGSPTDVAGTTSMWARLNAPDAVDASSSASTTWPAASATTIHGPSASGAPTH